VKLLYLVTEDSYFCSHRLPMARAAQEAGFDVTVVTNVNCHGETIAREGMRVIPLSLERRSLNPFRAIHHIIKIKKIYDREKPDIVHHIAMKPVLLGSISAWMAHVPHVVNAFAGLGYVFSADDFLAKFLRLLLVPAFFVLLRRPRNHLLLQNNDDLALLRRLKLVPKERVTVIPGSGIDLDACSTQPYPPRPSEFICVYAGRMIGIKGLQTLKAAFSILERRAPHVHLWLCGRPDAANPGSWTEERLQQWGDESANVTYKGYCPDMKAIWMQAHAAVQPSYGGEGVPKSLLEAAACARPVIATDVPGCRDMVEEGRNGFLVPAHDPAMLASALEKMAALSIEECAAMGEISRDLIVRKHMSVADVIKQTKALYLKLVAEK